MEKDALKWDRIFADRPDTPPGEPAFADLLSGQLQPGSVLDIASGDGAVALLLAARGFETTAADISSTGLARLSGFASARGLDVSTLQLDLDQPAGLDRLGIFDNITIARFKPEPPLWPALVAKLRAGGRLALVTFNLNHHQESGFPRRFCLAPEELTAIHPQLNLLEYQTPVVADPFLDSYLFEKTAS